MGGREREKQSNGRKREGEKERKKEILLFVDMREVVDGHNLLDPLYPRDQGL